MNIKWKKERAVYIVCYEGKPFMAFTDINLAFNWLKQERGAEQIQGFQFTRGFSIIDAPVMTGSI